MKKKIAIIIVSLVFLTTISIALFYRATTPYNFFLFNKSIKVGVLHSQTGTMALSEQPVIEATLLAIEEINQSGGLLGRKLEAIIADGASNWQTFAEQAETLINQKNVSIIFGCWTSASRKRVKTVVERYNHLLIYPLQYEGLEESPNIIYTGAAPNQQIIPGVNWAFKNLGKTFFLVGSDYVFPRTAHEIIVDLINALEGTVVGNEYIPLGSKDVSLVIQKIINTKPEVIINTINGDSNIPFFKKLRAAGITPEKIPTISFSIAEPELQQLDVEKMIGDYTVWNYFQSIARDENNTFVKRFKKKYGINRVISDPMEAAYFGVHLWAQAVKKAGSTDPKKIKKELKEQSFNAPEGIVSIDKHNNHTWKTVRIGKIQQNGQFMIIWDSAKAIKPKPYPPFKEKKEWKDFLEQLYKNWGNQWAP